MKPNEEPVVWRVATPEEMLRGIVRLCHEIRKGKMAVNPYALPYVTEDEYVERMKAFKE